MLQRLRKAKGSEQGFTLIELLVVVLIIAILAAIAIPVFLRQREKAWASDVQSLLRNGAVAVESASVDQGGSYAGIGVGTPEWDDAISRLKTEQTMTVATTDTTYCITVTDTRLAGHDWGTATFASNGANAGRPNDADTC